MDSVIRIIYGVFFQLSSENSDCKGGKCTKMTSIVAPPEYASPLQKESTKQSGNLFKMRNGDELYNIDQNQIRYIGTLSGA